MKGLNTTKSSLLVSKVEIFNFLASKTCLTFSLGIRSVDMDREPHWVPNSTRDYNNESSSMVVLVEKETMFDEFLIF